MKSPSHEETLALNKAVVSNYFHMTFICVATWESTGLHNTFPPQKERKKKERQTKKKTQYTTYQAAQSKYIFCHPLKYRNQ